MTISKMYGTAVIFYLTKDVAVFSSPAGRPFRMNSILMGTGFTREQLFRIAPFSFSGRLFYLRESLSAKQSRAFGKMEFRDS